MKRFSSSTTKSAGTVGGAFARAGTNASGMDKPGEGEGEEEGEEEMEEEMEGHRKAKESVVYAAIHVSVHDLPAH